MKGICPLCEAQIKLKNDVAAAELISCPECRGKIEVFKVDDQKKNAVLKEAPKIEEDWGQ